MTRRPLPFATLESLKELGRAIMAVLSWMLLAVLFAYMVYSTAKSLHESWAGGPLHVSARFHALPEEDFAMFWAAGRLVRAGHLAWLYSGPAFAAYVHSLWGQGLEPRPYLYPPMAFLVAVPASVPPLFSGFLLWDALSVVAAVALLRAARLPWPILLVGLAGPATWRSLLLGQYGLVISALVVAGLLLGSRRPIAAGIMLGLVTLKPQQGAMVAVAWLAARNGRAIAAAAACFAVLGLGVTLWLGGAVWTMFFTRTSVLMRDVVDATPPTPYINTGVSVFWMLRTFGASLGVANAAQAVAAVLAAGLIYRAWRRETAEPLARTGATVCLSLLATPYGYTSDMAGYSIAVAVVLAAKGWRLGPMDVLLWTWPFYCMVVTFDTGRLLTPVFVVVAAARCWRLMAPATASAGAPRQL